MFQVRIQILLAALTLLACGCGRQKDRWLAARPATTPASGEVTFEGKPLEGAIVVFQPTTPGGIGASGVTDAQGKFELKTFPPAAGAVPGPYAVSILKTAMPSGGGSRNDESEPVHVVSVIPNRYSIATESGLNAQIPEAGTEDLVFHLKP